MRIIRDVSRAGLPCELLSAKQKFPLSVKAVGRGGGLPRRLLRAQSFRSLLLLPPPSLLPATLFPARHTAVLPTLLPDYLSSGFLEQMFLAPRCIKNKQELCCHLLSWGKSLCCSRFFWRGSGRAVKSLHAASCQEFASRWMAGPPQVF